MNRRKERNACAQELPFTLLDVRNVFLNSRGKDKGWIEQNIVQAYDLNKLLISAKEVNQIRTINLSPEDEKKLEEYRDNAFLEIEGLQEMYEKIERASQIYIDRQSSEYKTVPNIAQKVAAARIALT